MADPLPTPPLPEPGRSVSGPPPLPGPGGSTSGTPAPPLPEPSEGIPAAPLVDDLRQTRLWVLPLLALFLLVGLGIRSLGRSPASIMVRFQKGNGIKTGDAVKFRGIDVGLVAGVGLAPDLLEVRVRLELEPAHRDLAGRGATFWIVHPQAGLYAVRGLETLIGPRYIALSPGAGPFQDEFIGLEDPPPLETTPGSLEIVLLADNRGSLRPGAPLHYRQTPVGSVVSVGLAPDALAVEVRALIEPRFRGLVRDDTRFWNTSGLALDFGLLKGFSLDMESLQTLLAGGISFATPDAPGNPVQQGHRFPLAARPDPGWLAWRPALWLGDPFLPAGAPLPATVRIQSSWAVERLAGLWKEDRQQRSWSLPLAAGLLCPSDLCVVPGNPDQAPVLQALGRRWAPPPPARWLTPSLALLQGPDIPNPWPATATRSPTSPEDCCAVGDPLSTPIPLQAARLRPAADRHWIVDAAVGLPPAWHGAAVLARRDGRVLGLLLVRPGEPARVALLPENGP